MIFTNAVRCGNPRARDPTNRITLKEFLASGQKHTKKSRHPPSIRWAAFFCREVDLEMGLNTKHEQVGGSADASKTQKHRQVGGC